MHTYIYIYIYICIYIYTHIYMFLGECLIRRTPFGQPPSGHGFTFRRDLFPPTVRNHIKVKENTENVGKVKESRPC